MGKEPNVKNTIEKLDITKSEEINSAIEIKDKKSSNKNRYYKKKDFKKKDEKVNSSKFSAFDASNFYYVKNDTNLKVELSKLGNIEGTITLKPENFTTIHDIDVAPIFGTINTTQTVLDGKTGEVGFMLNRFTNQMMFPRLLTTAELLNTAQQNSVDISLLTQLAPMIASKSLKVNPYGFRPNFILGINNVNDLGYNNQGGLLVHDLTTVESIANKDLFKWFEPLLDSRGTDFDIFDLYLNYQRLDNRGRVEETITGNNVDVEELTNAFGYLKLFYDKFIAAVHGIFKRFFILTKVAENVRHQNQEATMAVNYYAEATKVNRFRSGIASLMSTVSAMRTNATFDDAHTKEFNNITKATTGRTTATDVLTTTYFNFGYQRNQNVTHVGRTTLPWARNVDDLFNFENFPSYHWSVTRNISEVDDDTDFVADVMMVTGPNTAQRTTHMSANLQQTMVNSVLSVYAMLEPTNIPWSMMNSRRKWTNWAFELLNRLARVQQHLLRLNVIMQPLFQVITRSQEYGLNTNYVMDMKQNSDNLIAKIAYADVTGGTQTIKILNDILLTTHHQAPSNGTVIEAYNNNILFNSLISTDQVQYFFGEQGIYGRFYTISRYTTMVTYRSSVGYELDALHNNEDGHTNIAHRSVLTRLVLLDGNDYVTQAFGNNSTASNLLINYSSKLLIQNHATNNNNRTTVYDSSNFGVIDFQVKSLYDNVMVVMKQAELKQV